MNKTKTILSAFSIVVFLTFFSGITRHDVNEDEYLKLAQETQFDCVGQIFKDTIVSGSCVLISERFVLSAAHVFIESDTRIDTLQTNGKSIVLYRQINDRTTSVHNLFVVFKGQRVRVKRLIIHPYYLDSLTKGSCDIALLELETPLTVITPASLNSLFNEINSNVVGVGFGASGPADRPDLVSLYNKKIAGENVVDSISGFRYFSVETILMCDFDHPSRKDCNKMGSSTPRPLEYVCSGGDSGGGLFNKKGREWELVGICAGSGVKIGQFMKTYYYGQTMEWTRVSAFTTWIANEMK